MYGRHSGDEMNVTSTISSRRTARGQALVAVLLVFIFIAQPALAMFAVGCPDATCAMESDGCCCSVEVTPVATPETSCCTAEEPNPSIPDGPSVRSCECGLDSVPVPLPDLMLTSSVSGENGQGSYPDLEHWIRGHAESFARLLSGPPRFRSAGSEHLGVGKVPPPVGASCALAGEVPSVHAWSLLTRGVARFLAVLSVARI
ncbi:MAG: hypothetical protein ACI8QZ_002342 [Chlamydiales bacterium]|jgi:hypothetical protein